MSTQRERLVKVLAEVFPDEDAFWSRWEGWLPGALIARGVRVVPPGAEGDDPHGPVRDLLITVARDAMVEREGNEAWRHAQVRWSVELSIDHHDQWITGEGADPMLALGDLIAGAKELEE